jgi:UDP-N-acetylmuramyl pentapeptide phosphotransferase/UDP-N-acetylglucosamine-1-phosphate transferase
MEYLIIIVILFALELFYFKIADKYNIIDKPNHRSAHSEITLRGGGVIFPIAFLLYAASYFFRENSILSPQNYLIFGIGLLAICTISFIDDILDLSSKIRLVFHFLSVSLLLYFINVLQLLPIWAIPILYMLIIGILNAYNFMDGINGITGLYSLVTLLSLLYVNQNMVSFVDGDFIIYPILACLVFLFFNFRKKRSCQQIDRKVIVDTCDMLTSNSKSPTPPIAIPPREQTHDKHNPIVSQSP